MVSQCIKAFINSSRFVRLQKGIGDIKHDCRQAVTSVRNMQIGKADRIRKYQECFRIVLYNTGIMFPPGGMEGLVGKLAWPRSSQVFETVWPEGSTGGGI
jgi:hypothetical protein